MILRIVKVKVGIALFFLIGLSACADIQPLKYSDESIEFSLPSGWFVKQISKPSEDAVAIILQNGKLIPKGLFTVSVFKEKLDLASTIKVYKDMMGEQKVGMLVANTNFDDMENGRFGFYKTASLNYDLDILKRKSKGAIHAFHDSNKTIVIILQEIRGRGKIHKEGLRVLEETLRVKHSR